MFKKIISFFLVLTFILSVSCFVVSAENDSNVTSPLTDDSSDSSNSSEETSEIPSNIGYLEVLTSTEGYMSLSVGRHEYTNNINEKIQLIPNYGYHVYGVEINGVFQLLENDIVEIPVTIGNVVTVRPKFRGNVTFNVQQSNGGKLSPEGVQYVGTGKYFDITAIPDNGYVCTDIFINDVNIEITKDGNIYKGSFKAPKEKEYQVFATFAPVETHTATLTKNEGGKVLPFNEEGKAYITSGDNANFQILPDEGYGIKSVKVNGNEVGFASDGLFTVNNVTADFSVEVEFAPMESIPVVINKKGKGSVTQALKAYINSTLVIEMIPEEGHEVVSILVNGTATAIPENGKLQIAVTEELAAVKEIKIDISFDIIAEKFAIRTMVQNSIGGTITAKGYNIENMRVQVRKGGSITLSFIPDMNYIIDKVKVDGIEVQLNSDNTYTLNNVTDSHNVIVYYIPDPASGDDLFKISVNVGKGGNATPSSEQLVKMGESITFTFQPDSGKILDYILVDGIKEIVTNNTYVFENVVSDHTLEVFFKDGSEASIDWNAPQVEIPVPNDGKINNEILQQIKEKASDKVISFKGSGFIWTVPKGKYLNETSLDLNIKIGKSYISKDILDALDQKMVESRIPGLPFEAFLTNVTSLPDGTMMTITLGSYFIGQTVDFLYYDEENKAFVSVVKDINSNSQDPVYTSEQFIVDKNGKVTVPYNGNKNYFLVVYSGSVYKMNVIVGENGTASPIGESTVKIGDTSTISVSPFNGYMIESIMVNGVQMFDEFIGSTSSVRLNFGKILENTIVEISFASVTSQSGEHNSGDASISDVIDEGGIKPWVVALIIIGIAIIGGVVLFIYKWNEEKDIVD